MENQFKLQSIEINKTYFEQITHTEITWLGGSGFLVNANGMIILIDPLLSVMPKEPQISECGLKLKINLPLLANKVPKVDYVLYTHSDIDHLGPITALAMSKLNAEFIGTYPVYHELTQLGVNPRQVKVCRIRERITIGDLTIEVTPADHPWQLKSIEHNGRPFRIGDCCGFILNIKKYRLFFPGDTRLMEEHLDVKDIDLLALDVSMDEYHLNHTSAVVLANNLPNAYLFPVHYGTYDTKKLAHIGDPSDIYPHIVNADERGLILSPGEIFIVKKLKE